jgi:anaerobic selenocysteine-containing dehydrogenase
MPRKGDTSLISALKREGKKIKRYIQKCLHKDMKVKLLIEDARDSSGKASGAAYFEIEIDKKNGWGKENQVEIHGTIGFDKSGKKGKKEDEAYLDGVTVGDWDEGSKAIDLNGCSIGEFLVHIFTLFAIKAGNESVLLDNAAGPRGEHIYKQVGFIKSKGDRAQYGEDNEMIFSLTGKKNNRDAGQIWRERYNKFRKKLKLKIKNKENCKSFWKCVPPALESPYPIHVITRGGKRKTHKNYKNYKSKKNNTKKLSN